MQFFCIGSLEMMANALAIVWTARALQTGGFNEAKQTKNVISVHTVHARTSPVHARMVRLVRTHLAQQNRSDNTHTTARRAQQVSGKNPPKIWRHSVHFQRRTTICKFARSVEAVRQCTARFIISRLLCALQKRTDFLFVFFLKLLL